MADKKPQQPHPPVYAEPADLERFRTEDRLEINRVLRDLARRSELTTIYFGNTRDFVLTSVIGADSENDRVYLDYGADEDANRRLLSADRLQFIANHNRVRVQFSSDRIEIAEYEDGPAFVIPFPDSMVRIQRREFYRLSTPIGAPLACRFVLDGQEIQATVVDISLGGIGLLEPGQAIELKVNPGDIIEDCTIDLPEEGLIETAIEVRNSFEVVNRAGHEQHRVGCRFLSLNPRMNAQIQRYIHKVELERRRRTRGDTW